jgi:adenosylcobyric acid synthase
MLLGTGSHVGRSLLAASICRVLADDGFRVAPFKAQNMSLNSAAMPDGGGIGRAQSMQAEAARVVPTADMNPILLKAHLRCGLVGRAAGARPRDAPGGGVSSLPRRGVFPAVLDVYGRPGSVRRVIGDGLKIIARCHRAHAIQLKSIISE